MELIAIDRFRSVHQHGRVTLTAALSERPTARWGRLCEDSFVRYFEGFGERPALVDSDIVVSTTSRGLAASEMALSAVVEATNCRYLDVFVDSP